MFCKECGTKIDDDAKFCSNCGATTSSIGAEKKVTYDSGSPLITVRPVFIP